MLISSLVGIASLHDQPMNISAAPRFVHMIVRRDSWRGKCDDGVD
jgi:hypothetical protein